MAQLQGTVNWITRPTALSEGSLPGGASREGRFGEMAVVNYYADQYPLALEGSYWLATNPTPGTGVAMTTSLTNFASGGTKPFLYVGNNNTTASGLNIELDYLSLILTAGQLPTTATNMQVAISLDTVASKAATGTAVTPVNPFALNATSTGAQILNTATTNADSGVARLVFHDYVEPIVGTTPCAVAGDFYSVKFGAIDHVNASYYYQGVAAGTPLAVKQISSAGPPIVIPPGWAACIKVFGLGLAAAPTFEFNLGYRER